MVKATYNWKRFWCPREGQLRPTSEGYLTDPEGEYGRVLNPDVVSFDDIAGTRCLVLLGEPGIGKSTELNRLWSEVETKAESTGDLAQRFDLRNYQEGLHLCQELFDQNPTFQAWLNGSAHLHLFLDSLDEGILSIRTLAALLADRLGRYDSQRLLLRIACRTAEWPNVLETALRDSWGEEHVGFYELAPLRRVDVSHAALANGLDAEAFLDAVAEREVAPLAIKPITLEFLLAEFRRSHSLPTRRAELYEHGCRFLCEEVSDSRRASGYTGALSADGRLEIATRIAAVTMFCNKAAIWIGAESARLSGYLMLRDFGADAASQDAVRETLSTGLFSSRGPERIGWAHQTYAEFLAARLIKQQDMPLKQVMSLLKHTDGKFIPQLHEVTAWLAGMDSSVFKDILESEPLVLLHSDVSAANVTDRENLVAVILGIFDREEMLDEQRRDYAKLKHSGLAAQLRPFIIDSSRGYLVRRVAVDIAEACGLQELQEDILQVALNPAEPTYVRENAAWAIVRIADNDTKVRLQALLPGESDDLKGLALTALWPESIGAEELFGVLTPPNRESPIGGAYWQLIHYQLVEHLRPDDLPFALQWLERNPHQQGGGRSL